MMADANAVSPSFNRMDSNKLANSGLPECFVICDGGVFGISKDLHPNRQTIQKASARIRNFLMVF